MIIIDATGAAMGRIATFAAKQALLGKEVAIVNCENAVITGRKSAIMETYKTKRSRGGYAQKGPYFPSSTEMIFKRTIRGMLPWKIARGKKAFKLVKCFNGLPAEYAASEKISFKSAKKPYLKLKELSNLI